MCCHIGQGFGAIKSAPDAPIDNLIILACQVSAIAAQDLLWGPAMRSYPDLKIAFSEGGIGWIPFYLDRCDRHYTNQQWLRHDFGGKLPSDVFRDHSLACYVTDPTSLKLRHDIGIDIIAWECDYPHSDSIWPDAPEFVIDELVGAGADDDDIDKITWQNASRFFSWDPFAYVPRDKATVGALRAQARRRRRVDPVSQGVGRALRRAQGGLMTDFDSIDFFRDDELLADPYPYFDHFRSQCPVRRERHHDVMMVTGYEEALAVFRDLKNFSSCNSVTGPFPGFPVPLEGDDVSDLIEQYRDQLPMSDQLPTLDPPKHTDHRGLLMRLITPKRLKENEDNMWTLADQVIDEFLAKGQCEWVGDFAGPFAMLVIADLLGVPEADHDMFRARLTSNKREVGGTHEELAYNPLEFLYDQFTTYIEDRRQNPRNDVLTGLAQATFRDGSTPEVRDAAAIASNLFAAGQETTVRLLAYALQLIGEQPELQARLRGNRDLIFNFIEEALRHESPIKGDFRLARVPTTVGERRDPRRDHGHGAQRRRQP